MSFSILVRIITSATHGEQSTTYLIEAFSILVRIVSSATCLQLHQSEQEIPPFSILVRIVSSATKARVLFWCRLNVFQYPRSDRFLCNYS